MLGFSKFGFETNSEFGDFYLKKGVFTIKKAGMYQFKFTGLVKVTDSSTAYQFKLRADGLTISLCCADSTIEGLQHIVLFARQYLHVGQKVVMIRVSGGLYEARIVSPTQFSCKFVAEK